MSHGTEMLSFTRLKRNVLRWENQALRRKECQRGCRHHSVCSSGPLVQRFFFPEPAVLCNCSFPIPIQSQPWRWSLQRWAGIGNKNLYVHLLLLLLSRFSRVRLCATPETAAPQAPPSLGFSRQEHWSGLPFPSPMHENEKWKWICSVVSGP